MASSSEQTLQGAAALLSVAATGLSLIAAIAVVVASGNPRFVAFLWASVAALKSIECFLLRREMKEKRGKNQ